VHAEGREFVLVGTAHVSQESADLVRRVIETLRPDCVCLELDERRHAALRAPERFASLDLREVMRHRQLATLGVSLLLSAYQRALGLKLGVMPGTELLEGARAAEAHGIPVRLADRDVQITLRRAWRSLGFFRRAWLAASLFGSLFDRAELGEDDLRELRQRDVLTNLLEELSGAFPGLKTVLIDERDAYLAARLREAPGARVVAVVGAGHVQGLRQALEDGRPVDLDALEEVPPPSGAWRVVGWAVPAAIVLMLLAIGWRQGLGEAGESALVWVLANGIPSALGAIAALAHPLTVFSAFAAAPFTSLTPVIGAGYVTAFVQAWLRPPRVRELTSALEDAVRPSAWWRNRLLRVLLVFVLTTVGSLVGTGVGGAWIARALIAPPA
jgi:pheromone shutdown-related protein TraB